MGFVIARLFIRLSFLFFIVWGILYFYVFGYKISLSDDLTYRTAGVVNFIIFSKKNYFYLDGKKIYLVDNKVSLYSLYDGHCAKIEIGNYVNYTCFSKNKSVNFTYISPEVLKLKMFKEKIFFKINLKCFSKSNCEFKANKIKFIIQNNKLYYQVFNSYRFLYNLGDFSVVGYEENSIILYKKGLLYKLTWGI